MILTDEGFYVVAPERSLAQRMTALHEANRIRVYRAQLKRDMKTGLVGLVDLLGDRDCDSMRLFEAMLAMPRVGRVKANKVLAQCRISPSKTIGGLTERQRHEVLARLGARSVAR